MRNFGEQQRWMRSTIKSLKAQIASLEATVTIKDQIILDMKEHQSQLLEALIDWNIHAGAMKPRDKIK